MLSDRKFYCSFSRKYAARNRRVWGGKKKLTKRLLANHDFLPLNAQIVMMGSQQIQQLHLPETSLKDTSLLPPFLSLV